MPITPTYPGVYIEELPSFSHSVTAAPTSVTVFVGTPTRSRLLKFGAAIEIFSFADIRLTSAAFSLSRPGYPTISATPFSSSSPMAGRTPGWSAWSRPPTWMPPASRSRSDGTGMTLSAASAAIDVAPATVTLTAREPAGVDPASNRRVATGAAGQRTPGRGHRWPTSSSPTAPRWKPTGPCPRRHRSQLAQSALVEVTVTNGPPGDLPGGVHVLGYATAPPVNSTLINQRLRRGIPGRRLARRRRADLQPDGPAWHLTGQ